MTAAQPVSYFSPGAILNAPKKMTVIRLRWLIIIVCSYLLLSSAENVIAPDIVQQLVLGYVLSGAVLYFFPKPLFEDPCFYSPLVVFDTLFITASLVITRQLQTEFYLAYFLIIILCAVWKDLRWSVGITTLIALLYGYLLFRYAETAEPGLTLRVPFLFAVSLFYGYFVQLSHHERIRKGKAREAARIDGLTGLLSRSMMEKEFKKEFERARRYQRDLALLLLDIDDFKVVNETYGRSWGDRVLRKIAEHLRENLRESDLAGKYGEEEFVVLLPETGLEESLRTAERICTTMRQTIFETADGDFSVTVSIGITSTSEKEYEDYREMLSEAERMLYVAKHSGKDRIEPSRPGMHDLVVDGLAERKLLH